MKFYKNPFTKVSGYFNLWEFTGSYFNKLE